MKHFLTTLFFAVLSAILLVPGIGRAQGNIDWDVLWELDQPLSSSGTLGWMAGQRQYTSIAYDKWRDVVYIVNPAMCNIGGQTFSCPKIRILDGLTGNPATSVGRASAGILGITAGEGGYLPLPIDTVVAGTRAWPNSTFGSFSQGQFPVYKIDLDDEGRIFACNLISPIWGICFPGPPPNCDPIYLSQGPFRVYRWDTPKSSPKRVYATLNPATNYTSTGSWQGFIPRDPGSEMDYYRWGDAFDVVGKRGMFDTGEGIEEVDSVRIFTSGGFFSGQSTGTNPQINVFLTDRRGTNKKGVVSNGMGETLEYRLGIRLFSSLEGIASHGIAVTGPSAISEIWHDNNNRVTTLNNQGQTAGAFPQEIAMTRMYSLSGNSLTGTDMAGSLAYFGLPQSGDKFLICADGYPSNPQNPTDPNSRTKARIMNVTVSGAEHREINHGNTPGFPSQKILSPNSGVDNYIADVDFQIISDDSGHPHVILYLLMSNNGIAAYYARQPIWTPVELSTFRGILNGSTIDLLWQVTAEVNNYGFEVQRSFDQGRNWEDIGFVAGRGSTNSPKEYLFSDPVTSTHRNLGAVKYRLRQMDFDGKTNISPVVDVYMSEIPNTITLEQNYPNPFNPSTTIAYQLTKPGHVTVKLFNTLGDELAMLVNEAKEAGAYTVNFTSGKLPSGSYIYQLNVDGQIVQKKMMLMK